MRDKLIKSKTLHTKLSNKAKDIVSDIHICLPLDLEGKNKIKCLGVWDTGSHSCLISSELIKTLDPPFIGFKLLSGVVGNKMANEYLLNIHLSKDFIIEGVTACEAPNLEDSEFLIGMDIINMGDFAITNVSKKTSLSYRQPSLFRINFQTDKEKAIKEKELLVKKQNKATLKTKKNRKRKRKGKSKKFRK